MLSAQYADKPRPIVNAIEWQKGADQVKEVVAKNSESQALKESGGEVDDKDAEIKALNNRVSEL